MRQVLNIAVNKASFISTSDEVERTGEGQMDRFIVLMAVYCLGKAFYTDYLELHRFHHTYVLQINYFYS